MSETARRDGAWRVFRIFLWLGLTSFGGPVAHLGYFRAEFVVRRRWLDERSYSDLVALCQFLPGPASSQVGMALGLGRAGWPGLFAAWSGFTLPSAVAMILFAFGIAGHRDAAGSGWVHGLKIAAVAVVAQAVWGMARSLCPDRPRALLAIASALLAAALPAALGQVGAIAVAGLLGAWMLRIAEPAAAQAIAYPVSRRLGVAALAAFALPLLALPLWAAASGSASLALVAGVYRAGALVFGGGHVVLPLLQSAVVPSGAVGDADFLAGYGAAQALPGPLFAFAAYLGAIASGPLHGWLGGFALLGAIFLPALLVLVGTLPFWEAIRHRARIRNTMAGINAGVVGLLAAAWWDPVCASAIHRPADAALALAAFAWLGFGRGPPALVVLATGLAGWALRL